MKVMVTGATGFVGKAVVKRLMKHRDIQVISAIRGGNSRLPAEFETTPVSDLAPDTNWMTALTGVDVIIHAAARVHIMRDQSANPLAEFRRINVQGTLNLARQAVASGVRRFLFISSIKVNGETTELAFPFRPDDIPAPIDPYGTSKMEAEQGLRDIEKQTGMEIVIIRPPLVYGPGVKANFLAMMRWVQRGLPLPLGSTHNKRSLVAIDNLVDLLATCIDHPAAANQIFLISDGEDISTTQLLRRMGEALGRPAKLIPVPPALFRLSMAMIRKPEIAKRLLDSLQVDISTTHSRLNWRPPIDVDEGLRRIANSLKSPLIGLD